MSALVLAVGAVAGAACVPATAPPPPPPTVIIYGDSLTTESHEAMIQTIQAERPGTRVLVRQFGGTAICNWFASMVDDGDENAQLVVLQFNGNPQACNGNHAGGSPLWLTRATADAEHAVEIWEPRGVPVLFVANPRGIDELVSQLPHALDAAYASIAAAHPATTSFSSTSAEALSTEDPLNPGQRFFTYEMDCLPTEGIPQGCGTTTPGKIPVRTSPTDGHLCTGVTGLLSACPTYASGVHRFGTAVGHAAAALLP